MAESLEEKRENKNNLGIWDFSSGPWTTNQGVLYHYYLKPAERILSANWMVLKADKIQVCILIAVKTKFGYGIFDVGLTVW